MALERKQLTEEQTRLVTVSLIVIAAVALAAGLAWTRPVMVPFILSVFVYYLVSPIADWLELRLRFPRWLSTLVVLTLVAGGIFVLGALITTSVRGLGFSADIYREKLVELAGSIAHWLDARGIDLSQDALIDTMRNLPVSKALQASAGMAFTLISNGTLVVLFVVFLLLGRKREMIKHPVFKAIDRDIRRYLVVKFVVSAAAGIIAGLILFAFGLELALVFGVITFVLHFIPNIGAIVAIGLPLPIALVQYDTLGPVIAILILLSITHTIIGSVVDPMLMGEKLDLSPVTILVGLVFWALLWGAAGALLAAPLTAILRIVLQQFETTRPMTELMAGRLPSHDDDDSEPLPRSA